MHIQLVVTGDLERVALGASLARLFGASGTRIDILGQGTPSPVTYPSRIVRDANRTLRNL